MARRNDITMMSPAELAIRDAVRAVEKMPADPLLTQAVNSLQYAATKVADFIDGTVVRDEAILRTNGNKVPEITVQVEVNARDIGAAVAKRVAELSDRTSPDYWPEAMLVTPGELIEIIADELQPLEVVDGTAGEAARG